LYYIKCLLVHTKAESAEDFLWLTMLILPMFVLPVLILPIFVLPVSVHGVQQRLFIDIDEATFTLKATNQTAVHGHMSLHVRKSGHWTRGKKVSVLCGIEAGNPGIQAGAHRSLQHLHFCLQILDMVFELYVQIKNKVRARNMRKGITKCLVILSSALKAQL